MSWVKREFWTGYSWFERLFMASMLAIQIIVFAINPESLISVIAGIAGVISVVLCAKGKISSYFIGFVQNALYT